MSLSIGMRVQIRAMVFVAGEPIPYFWPMRSFIHHNPLHGLEHKTFEEAIAEGKRLFHGVGFLSRTQYQQYFREGKIAGIHLEKGVEQFLTQQPPLGDLDLHACLMMLLTDIESPITSNESLVSVPDIAAALRDEKLSSTEDIDLDVIAERMCETLYENCPLYDTMDKLFGTGIAEELDELVIKSCLDFFDEGQSVWQMPGREKGFFLAWREVALKNARLLLRGRQIHKTLQMADDPEDIIVYVMENLGIPKDYWMKCFRLELAKLHGWAGFIRWRSSNRQYYKAREFPGDLVDFLAIRLTLALALIRERAENGVPRNAEQLQQFIRQHPMETYLRRELYDKRVLASWAHKIAMALHYGKRKKIEKVGLAYMQDKRTRVANIQADLLKRLAKCANAVPRLESMPDNTLKQVLDLIRRFEKHEGMLWLEAMEATAMHDFVKGVQMDPPPPTDKRPFAQALFCIDTRSERLRRHLESVGDYQTFGIAGFFGVPVSFIELGKGTETHLCPVILTPKNLVMEMSVTEMQDTVVLSALENALHDLKESVLAPFVTVEAIGLIFGFDMVGKTLAPRSYNRWRSKLNQPKPHTHLLIDKLSKEQADSIVRAVQRAVISNALEYEFEIPPEEINDDLVRELREAALGNITSSPLLEQQLKHDAEQAQMFIQRLRSTYLVNASDARMQMERLGRIGFSLDEQVGFVSQALRSIGLTENFSRFVLVVGHGSQSENNPYESALDCGACGGNKGLVNARIFANMSNKPAVRHRLKSQGIDIPDDAWFIPALHNTTTDEVAMHDLDLLPSTHPIYLDRLQNALISACRLCTQERVPSLEFVSHTPIEHANKRAQRNAMDWSQVRPEWGLSRNVYFVIGRRQLTEKSSLDGRAFLHSYDYRVDNKQRLLENIITGPLVVGQWINMEHYFSTVDNENYGSGSKVYHNVAGRFAVMTGNLSDLRTGLPAQTVLADGKPYHEPMRLITVIDAPMKRVQAAIDRVAIVRKLLINGWIRLMVIDPETKQIHVHNKGQWHAFDDMQNAEKIIEEEAVI